MVVLKSEVSMGRDNENIYTDFHLLGWPVSEWRILHNWFQTRYGLGVLPSTVQKWTDTWGNNPFPGKESMKYTIEEK
jgi:hypothetical protein